jgi:hypothetical protein
MMRTNKDLPRKAARELAHGNSEDKRRTFLPMSNSSQIRLGQVVLVGAVCCFAGGARADSVTTHPYVGVRLVARRDSSPRPLKMNIVDIDLTAPGLRFKLTPHRGPKDTMKEGTLEFLTEQRAQLAINAHFFEPWPPPSPDDGSADLVGIAASEGNVYSPFESNPPKSYAINSNSPGLNLGPDNRATIVHRNLSDPSGRTVAEAVTLWNTVSGNEQIISNGVVVAAKTSWNNTADPRTVIGLTTNNHLILFTVDGRQAGVSEGLTVFEAANLVKSDYGVTEALDLDGGGSTTLAMDLPTSHMVNTPSANPPRSVGSSLGVFAVTTYVAMISVTNGATFAAPATIPLTATAAHADGLVTNVAFYQGATKLTDAAASPFSYHWSGVAAGNYALEAVATDDHGLRATSSVVNVTVSAKVAPNAPATVTPTNGAGAAWRPTPR